MVFSGLLTAADRSPSSRSRASSAPEPQPEYIVDEAQLPCIPPERPDLHELNNCLDALAAVFPDIQIEVFRELLFNFDGESRLALVADALLKNRVTWVKGRWRVADKHCVPPEGVPRGEIFRSPEYKKAVRSLAFTEFKGLPRSAIDAVLAESNHSYLDARQTLVTLSSKSWRFTISSLLRGRKVAAATSDPENHPLIAWRSSGRGSITPTIRATGNAELDRELYDALIRPVKQQQDEERELRDRGYAVLLNIEEAEDARSTHECTCCFATGAFEGFTHCNKEGHMICFRCVQHSMKEALFGQGWISSINPLTGTLRCLAVDGDGCPGHVPFEHISRAMLEEKNGAELLHNFDQRLAQHSLLASKLPLIRCPFCSYAEIDDIYMPSHEPRPRLKADSIYNIFFIALCLGSVPFIFPVILISSLICLLTSVEQSFGDYLSVEWARAQTRHSRRRRGLRFSCQNPRCGRVSCLSCSKAWADVHICHESSLVALRTQVEQAMSMAIKRVCPRCNTSFVKNSGCNKLTCPCGYKMCYVCRADLSDEGYRHFCDHFRPDGDPRPCKDCNRCNLWESEDTDQVLREAQEEAERRWKAMENRDLSGSERAFLETGVATRQADVSVGRLFLSGTRPTIPELFDFVVETIYV